MFHCIEQFVCALMQCFLAVSHTHERFCRIIFPTGVLQTGLKQLELRVVSIYSIMLL